MKIWVLETNKYEKYDVWLGKVIIANKRQFR